MVRGARPRVAQRFAAEVRKTLRLIEVLYQPITPIVDSPGMCSIHIRLHLLMRTNIVLDDALVDEALEITGTRTKREVVHMALQELVRSRKKKNLADLAGKIRFRAGFDHKAMRKLRG